ncbi:ROK family protein [Mesorhizobium sp. YM1C-6-2]|uniref:ROK family protein n=1 Tax=Mesorhizobium sp. YM1C-6-2 TaxID=1827501 RepID=UPI000EF28AD0|nr:ROK family protein [Mesorhizobium sp. YM1C-6-2]RLP22488.1 ROK family transcriptional regulator [Mesorhizobium sp. YM1C-6-2]
MTAGIRHDDLRRRNRAMVISAVRRSGQPSRTEIAAATGLSHSTISAISADLIAEGILAEPKGGELPAARRGRPQVALALDPKAGTVAVAVLSLNHLSAAIIDYAGGMVAEEKHNVSTAAVQRDDLVSELVAMLRRLTAGHTGRGKPLRIVLAIQGITDAAARAMLWSPITPHRDIPFADILEHEIAIPTRVENDCNMMAMALRWRDPSRYRNDFIAMLLSHGIGMGLVLKGELFTGTRSSGGEFGHMIHQPGGALCRCGRRGCVEAYAGDYAIWRNAQQKSEFSMPEDSVSNADMQAVAARARAAEGPEREAYRKAGTAIGYGIGSLFALIDPAPIAFIGGGADAFDLMEPHIRAAIAETAGGQHSDAISFDAVTDELPLIRQGCAMRALTFVDQEIFATRTDTPESAGKELA